jgi:hypothetical protein
VVLQQDVFATVAAIRPGVQEMKITIDHDRDPQRRVKQIDLGGSTTEIETRIGVQMKQSAGLVVMVEHLEQEPFLDTLGLIDRVPAASPFREFLVRLFRAICRRDRNVNASTKRSDAPIGRITSTGDSHVGSLSPDGDFRPQWSSPLPAATRIRPNNRSADHPSISNACSRITALEKVSDSVALRSFQRSRVANIPSVDPGAPIAHSAPRCHNDSHRLESFGRSDISAPSTTNSVGARSGVTNRISSPTGVKISRGTGRPPRPG